MCHGCRLLSEGNVATKSYGLLDDGLGWTQDKVSTYRKVGGAWRGHRSSCGPEETKAKMIMSREKLAYVTKPSHRRLSCSVGFFARE